MMSPNPDTPMPEPRSARELLLTRRRVVQAGGAVTAALYLSGLTGTASASGVASYLTRSAYTGLIGTPFAAVADSGVTAALWLSEVADLARAAHEPAFAGRDDAFALLFSGSPSNLLSSGIHELRHPALGAFSLFISPVQSGGGREQHYEVVVDRSVRLATALRKAPEPLADAGGAPAAAAAVAAAPAAAGAAPAAGTSPQRKKPVKLVQSVTFARRGGILTADIRVAPGRGVVSVRAVLLREGVEHARAARRLKGRAGVRLNLREVRPTPPGAYRLRVTVTDRNSKRTSSLRRVTVA